MSTRNKRPRCSACRIPLPDDSTASTCSGCRRQGVLFPKRLALRLARTRRGGGGR